MIFQKTLFRKVAILGVGLIGASVGLALKKKNLVKTIVGFGRHKSSLNAALRKQAIDEYTMDIKEAVKGADCVILAGPVTVICDHLEAISKAVKRNCIITDVGSSKANIVDHAHKVLPASALFIGSHPLAGSEKRGPEHATENLFEGAKCVLTPVEQTNRLAREKIKHLWTSLGADVHVLDPVEHDKTLAYISHLPHLAAFALMQSIPEASLSLGSTGLKDTTRIAASDPHMWKDIFLSNRQNMIDTLDEMVSSLATFRSALIDHDEKKIQQLCQQAKTKRDTLG